MDHDLQMMIYGALIGIGSSIITIWFQSWLNRREHERQIKEEHKREQQKILIPSMDETNAIRDGKFPGTHLDKNELTKPMKSRVGVIGALIGFLGTVLLCLITFSQIVDNPILYLIVCGCITYLITYIFFKAIKNNVDRSKE